ncbi:OmpA family protein [Cereibacter sphaeroides]|uniref:phosphate ABC transporter substrate-binding/OmpA family protein n=1 Tax=Cereibacter sphaeroides TaxID=1063 RepID=UPI001F466D65|nr:phosphate ABC transporter substrate-binding/OmpA family protein [Cereibacter sphaeroides]MCE6961079.1 OmpA family protein [Cereibacter sphaeroides]MCE6971726.1 OmpA family protein [Cereibacter sphaeroides]
MASRRWHAAIFAAILAVAGSAAAQDITLTSRSGAITLEGTLLGFDGEFYRIGTKYGPLTVDSAGVACSGPGCPELTAPLARIRILGATEAGNGLLPRVLRAYAEVRGYSLKHETRKDGFATEVIDARGEPVAQVSFTPATPVAAADALASGAAELVVSAHAAPGMTTRVLALDALVPIVATDNPLPRISTRDLARALSGEVASWKELGGPDMPLVLHALSTDISLEQALEARLGRPIAAAVTHPDLASLAAGVARDPYALAITGQTAQGIARVLPLTDSCGYPLLPTPLAVKSEDYPLALPVFLVTPRRRLPLFAREFLEFLSTAPARRAVAEAGFVDRRPSQVPLAADGQRLMNAIRGAGEEVSLDELKRLTDLMTGAQRLSLTFRFEDGAEELEPQSRDHLSELVKLMEIGRYRDQQLMLVGFSDGRGPAATNLDLSRSRAEAVAKALREALPELPAPLVEGFGEALPLACDTTVAGRRMNRRVELWLRPLTDSPGP